MCRTSEYGTVWWFAARYWRNTQASESFLHSCKHERKGCSRGGAALLKLFPLTSPFAGVVQGSQTPWQKFQSSIDSLKTPQRLSQIVHWADTITMALDDERPVLNQLESVMECIHKSGTREFSPEVLAAFEKLCGHELTWMDVMYRPDLFLDFLGDDRWFSLDETVKLTEFMSKIIDFRSPFTAMHSAGVAATATALAGLIGMSEDECKQMRIAGNLHDVGKLKVSNDILEKPGKLTDEEYNIMKEHAYYTWILLKDIRGMEWITQWASRHHEKLNGGGYLFCTDRRQTLPETDGEGKKFEKRGRRLDTAKRV